MQEALQRMREALGPDAVLVASREVAGGVRITAAVDGEEPDLEALLGGPRRSSGLRRELERLFAVLEVPERLAGALLAEAEQAGAADAEAALARALAAVLPFGAEAAVEEGAFALVGPPGAGKTATVAKLAALARLASRPVRVVSFDGIRAGGHAQLAALLGPLELEQDTDPPERPLGPPRGGLLLADTTGVHPLRGRELAALAELLARLRLEGVAVLPATLHPEDAFEMAHNLKALGIRRVVVTKLDLTRRLAALLRVLEAGLALAGVGIAPVIGSGLPRLTPAQLARLMVERAASLERR